MYAPVYTYSCSYNLKLIQYTVNIKSAVTKVLLSISKGNSKKYNNIDHSYHYGDNIKTGTNAKSDIVDTFGSI